MIFSRREKTTVKRMSEENHYIDNWQEKFEKLQAKYFDEKFDIIFEKLDTIDGNGKKTNGHVAQLFERMRTVELNHAECPIRIVMKETKDFREDQIQMKKDIEVVSFFQKHPQLLKFTLIGIGLLIVISIATNIGAFDRSVKAIKQINNLYQNDANTFKKLDKEEERINELFHNDSIKNHSNGNK